MAKSHSLSLESLLARLRNLARQRGMPAQQMLLFYFQERLLARVAASPYRQHLVLKGGLNLYSRYGASARPTIDIDLLGWQINHHLESVGNMFGEILQVDLADGVSFDRELSPRTILEEADYPGVRLEPVARFQTAHRVLQLDLSFGSVVTPGPEEIAFPSLLLQESYPILAYPLYTIVAEKLAAAVELGTLNTRIKDYFDLYTLVQKENFDPLLLQQAIQRSFAARGTPQGGVERITQLAKGDGLRLWQMFLRKNTLEAPQDFTRVVQEILAVLGEYLP